MAHGIPVIDAHIHLPRTAGMKDELASLLRRHPAFQELGHISDSTDALLAFLDAEGIEQAWPIQYHAEPMGYGRAEAEPIWELCRQAPDRLVAVGGYEPRDGDPQTAVGSLVDAGVRVLKIHPVHQGIAPADERLHGAYDAARAAGMPVIFHTGPSVFPGAANQFADPSLLEPVLQGWPGLQVIVGHGGRPDRTQEALRLVDTYPDTWLDLSGCPPKRLHAYFGDLTPLAGRTLWGTDWPGPGVPGLAANVAAFLALGYPDAVNQAILHDNAASLV